MILVVMIFASVVIFLLGIEALEEWNAEIGEDKRINKIKLSKPTTPRISPLSRRDFINRGYDPDECAECHLPGDCPLCGGK